MTSKSALKKAAIYIRVSTEGQRDEGYSIEAQTEMLRAYCISKQIKNYEFFIDGGFTGSNIERPEMQRLIREVKEGKISHVIVYKLDRLSRSQKDTLYLIEDVFNPKGVSFVSMNENMDTSTPIGRAMLGIMSAFAQLERETIKERTRMGMRERIKNGYWPGGGRIPFGYDYDSKQGILVPNKDAEKVRQAYELYLSGYSTDKIAKILGLKYERLALQILTRKSNAGYIIYNGEEYKGRHEPIISLETYEKAMEYMHSRSKSPVTEGEYLLTGLIECGVCGGKMRYQKWGKTDTKIVCYSRDKSKTHLIRDINCDNALHSAYKIEDIVLKDLFSLKVKEESEISEDIHSMLKSREESIEKKIKRLYNLYGESGDEILIETIKEQKSELEKIRKEIDNEEKRNNLAKEKAGARKKLKGLQDAWKYMSPLERKNVIRSCVEKVIIKNDDIDIFYKL